MNKKVKWSIISVSAATAFTFGGLVMNNQNTNTAPTLTNNKTQDNQSAFNDNDRQPDGRFSQGNPHEWNDQNNSDQGSYDEDTVDDDGSSIEQGTAGQGSSWGQDQMQQAPSGGFEQGQGSSGASR